MSEILKHRIQLAALILWQVSMVLLATEGIAEASWIDMLRPLPVLAAIGAAAGAIAGKAMKTGRDALLDDRAARRP